MYQEGLCDKPGSLVLLALAAVWDTAELQLLQRAFHFWGLALTMVVIGREVGSGPALQTAWASITLSQVF